MITRKERLAKRTILATFILFALGIFGISAQQPPSMPQIPPASTRSTQDLSSPRLAYFFGGDSHRIIRTMESGLQVYDTEKKQMIAEAKDLKKVTALRVFPASSDALAATDDGKSWLVSFDGTELNSVIISDLSSGKIGAIKSFLINQKDPNLVLASDSFAIYRSKDRGKKWDVANPITISNPEYHVINLLIQDPKVADNFIVGTIAKGRFLGNWNGNELKFVEEKAIPHGYGVYKEGITFIPLGDNAEIFGFHNYQIDILDMAADPSNANILYLAGMGISPLRLSLEGSRITTRYLNARINLSYSIDVNRSDPV
jgi:hypothetical protein